jgi:hypothetical protein
MPQVVSIDELTSLNLPLCCACLRGCAQDVPSQSVAAGKEMWEEELNDAATVGLHRNTACNADKDALGQREGESNAGGGASGASGARLRVDAALWKGGRDEHASPRKTEPASQLYSGASSLSRGVGLGVMCACVRACVRVWRCGARVVIETRLWSVLHEKKGRPWL